MKRMTAWAPAALPTCLLAFPYPWRNKTYIVVSNPANSVASATSSTHDCPAYCSSSRRHAPHVTRALRIFSIGNRSVTHRDLCLR